MSYDSQLKMMCTNLIMYINMFYVEHQISPRIYVGLGVYDIISQSSNFTFQDPTSIIEPECLGRFMDRNVFFSNGLMDDEYVLGTNEKEIDVCQRNVKLKKITDMINIKKK